MTMQGWVTRNRLREDQEKAKIERARKEGFDDGYLAGRIYERTFANYTVEPHYVCEQQISELDDRHNRMASPEYQAKVKADMDRRAVEIGVDRLVGITAFPVGNCPTCGELVAPWNKHAKYEGGFTCKPAQPSPVAAASEMPEAVHDAWILLDVFGQQDDDDGRAHRRAAVALREWWRSQPAPAAVRMTPELERLLQFAQAKADGTLSRVIHNDALADIAAVRAQAEQAQWVRLPKVRGFFNVVEGHAAYLGFARERKEALAEIDAAEGKVTE